MPDNFHTDIFFIYCLAVGVCQNTLNGNEKSTRLRLQGKLVKRFQSCRQCNFKSTWMPRDSVSRHINNEV